jgi:hypothetical protein
MFTHGDIVKIKFTKNGLEYFIVTDVYDFSEKQDGSDLNYEVMQIYPIAIESLMLNVDGSKLELHAKGNEKDGEMVIDFVMKERAKRGWIGVPDFQAVIYHNLKSDGVKKVYQPNLDIINYDKLETIDECLDAINDLNILHKFFGDEAYLQLREVVLKRLEVFK